MLLCLFNSLKQGGPTTGPRATSGPPVDFLWPAIACITKLFCTRKNTDRVHVSVYEIV